MQALRRYAYTIAAAGAPIDLRVEGDLIYCYDATNTFILYTDEGTPFLMERGLKLGVPFQTIRLENPSATLPVTINLVMGYGKFDDLRPMVRPQIASTSSRIWDAAFANSNSAPAAPLLEAANSNRVELIVYPYIANTNPIYLYSLNAAGKQLAQCVYNVSGSQSFRINYTGAVYGFGQNVSDGALVIATYYQ